MGICDCMRHKLGNDHVTTSCVDWHSSPQANVKVSPELLSHTFSRPSYKRRQILPRACCKVATLNWPHYYRSTHLTRTRTLNIFIITVTYLYVIFITKYKYHTLLFYLLTYCMGHEQPEVYNIQGVDLGQWQWLIRLCLHCFYHTLVTFTGQYMRQYRLEIEHYFVAYFDRAHFGSRLVQVKVTLRHSLLTLYCACIEWYGHMPDVCAIHI